MPRARKKKQYETPVSEVAVEAPLELVPFVPDEALPAFPIKLREPFPHLPEGFEARGTFEAAGVRVNRHASGDTALQFKDGQAMSFAEKMALEDKGYRYVPGDKQWGNPQASWENKLDDARALAEERLKERDR